MEQPAKDPLTPNDKIEKAFDMKNEGNSLFKAQNIQGAIKKYHSALLYVKGLFDRKGILRGLGADCSDTSDEDDTDVNRKKIKELQFLCYNNLAACLLKKENYERALENAAKALEIQPDNIKALFRKGTAQLKLKNYVEAEKDLNRILQLDPNEKSVQKHMKEIEAYKEKALQKQKQMYSKMF